MAPQPIVSYCTEYPPIGWDYIQDQLSEDSGSQVWQEITERYHSMLAKAGAAFQEYLDFDPVTELTAEDFLLDRNDDGHLGMEWYRHYKAEVRAKALDIIIEEDELPASDANSLSPARMDPQDTAADRRASLSLPADADPQDTAAYRKVSLPLSPDADPQVTVDYRKGSSADADLQATVGERTASLSRSDTPSPADADLLPKDGAYRKAPRRCRLAKRIRKILTALRCF